VYTIFHKIYGLILFFLANPTKQRNYFQAKAISKQAFGALPGYITEKKRGNKNKKEDRLLSGAT